MEISKICKQEEELGKVEHMYEERGEALAGGEGGCAVTGWQVFPNTTSCPLALQLPYAFYLLFASKSLPQNIVTAFFKKFNSPQ